jgi:hypothetical protein
MISRRVPCPWCQRRTAVRADGTLRAHQHRGRRCPGRRLDAQPCAGGCNRTVQAGPGRQQGQDWWCPDAACRRLCAQQRQQAWRGRRVAA